MRDMRVKRVKHGKRVKRGGNAGFMGFKAGAPEMEGGEFFERLMDISRTRGRWILEKRECGK